MKIHMSKKERRVLIFTVTLKIAQSNGLFRFTLDEVAKQSKCSKSLVKYHYGGLTNLREKVIIYGRENDIHWINNTSIMELVS